MTRKGGINKTRKAVAKRFKVTGTGKVLRRKQGKRHILQKKSSKRKRQLGKVALVDETQVWAASMKQRASRYFSRSSSSLVLPAKLQIPIRIKYAVSWATSPTPCTWCITRSSTCTMRG